MDDIVQSIVLFSVGVLLLGIIGSLVFSRAITQPLLMLASATEAFGRGELRTQVAIASYDEVGELPKTFNLMVRKRRQIESEREELIRNLQEALAKVKLQPLWQKLVPDIAIEKEVKAARLARLQMPAGRLEAGILMVWHRGKFISSVMAAFMDMAMDCFKASECCLR